MSYLKESWRSWLRWLGVVAAFSIACALLSNWQFHRNEEKLAAIALVQNNWAKPVAALESLVPSAGGWSHGLEWRSASLTGRYLPAMALLVRNRPNQGQGGFEQLVPFQTDQGLVLLVSRGWLPNGDSPELPSQNPLPSEAHRTIVVSLVESEHHDGRMAPTGQIINIEVNRALAQLGIAHGYLGFYGRATADDSTDPALMAVEPPSTDPGNNLSYAIQWIAFAVMACGALVWMFRTERDRYLGKASRPKRVRKNKSDEEIEDSLA